ncbi:MAG TPA: histidine kinase [Bryobacteraceae bacterium]|jgi:signal transduction histidine kinase
MLEGVSLQNPVFINTLGHASALVLFGLLIVLLAKGWTKSESRQRVASLIAAGLAFVWNLGSLSGLYLTQRGGQLPDWLVAINFSALSFLPSVLFAVILKRTYPWLARLGYLAGGCSVILHFAELQFPSAGLHEAALLLVTTAFGALTAALITLSYLNRDQCISLTDVICLLLFTLSFLHFGYGHSKTAWTNEVAWHHAGIPLALIVLLRDYRLLFLETFIRFLTNIGVAGLYAVLLYWINRSGHLIERSKRNSFAAALLLISFCCSLILFAYARALLQRRLTRSVFRRGDLNLCSKQILLACSESKTETELLESAAGHICEFAGVERFSMSEKANGVSLAASRPWAEVELPLRFSRGDSLALSLGPRRGSRRYLAEDIEALSCLSGLLVEQVERFRANELERLMREAELRALQAQVNPHFLFNALNTLYGTIDRESSEARRLVLNLAELLRYCLQRDRTLIPLGEELEIVQAYLEIESLRLGDRLKFEIRASERARKVNIPVLSVQPLVENAVKHGISRLSANGHVRVIARESSGGLLLKVHDNGPGFEDSAINPGLGLGLENVRRRLRLCYGPSAELVIKSSREGCTVVLSIPPETEHVVRLSPAHAGSHSDSVLPSAASTHFS